MNPAFPSENGWYYVYFLTNSKTPWIYIGCTHDLGKRVKEHNDGKVYTTKKMLPVELIYYEAYKCKNDVYKREKSLKEYGSGLAKLKSRLSMLNGGRAG